MTTRNKGRAELTIGCEPDSWGTCECLRCRCNFVLEKAIGMSTVLSPRATQAAYQRASSIDRYVCSVSSRKLAIKACDASQQSCIGVAMGSTNVAHCPPHRAICHPHFYQAKQ